MNILDEIVANKKKELAQRKKRLPFRKLYSEVYNLLKKDFYDRYQNRFIGVIADPKLGDVGVIAEIKLKSPTAGVLGKRGDVKKLALQYQKAYADAISVVTDEKYFGGDLAMIAEVKKTVGLPVFQKDFIIDEYQILEAKKNGVDAILLIAKLFDQMSPAIFDYCEMLGLTMVFEVYDEADLEHVQGAKVIGVNARNLQDFTVDVEKACRLIEQIPKETLTIGFSGVQSRQEVNSYKQAGAKAVLIGTNLMQSNDVYKFIHKLKNI